MSDTIIVAIIAFLGTLAGSFISKKSTIAVIEEKIKELTAQVEKHNSVISRTYELEKRMSVAEERQKVANNRIDDLERKTE